MDEVTGVRGGIEKVEVGKSLPKRLLFVLNNFSTHS